MAFICICNALMGRARPTPTKLFSRDMWPCSCTHTPRKVPLAANSWYHPWSHSHHHGTVPGSIPRLAPKARSRCGGDALDPLLVVGVEVSQRFIDRVGWAQSCNWHRPTHASKVPMGIACSARLVYLNSTWSMNALTCGEKGEIKSLAVYHVLQLI